VTTSVLDGDGRPLTDPLVVVDEPRRIDPGYTTSDHVFRNTVRSVGIFVLILTGSIGVFLGYQSVPTLSRYGFSFFTQSQWNPAADQVGIAAVLIGTVLVAIIALVIGFPLAFATALFISEYCPERFKSSAVAGIDLMAAVPSIIYGLFGFAILVPQAENIERWLHQNFGFIPIFKAETDPNAASWTPSAYYGSAFIAGLCVSLMIIPLACSVMRGVFALAPIGEREAAYALGSTKWGMVRTVVLPFGRGGIIGGTMLGLGRALGETVAVLLVISQTFEIKLQVLSSGVNTTSALIASHFSEATPVQLSALLSAGFVLFLMTLGVNTVAAIFVTRSRSGAGVDI
jgi:phosphate transport system permease protein